MKKWIPVIILFFLSASMMFAQSVDTDMSERQGMKKIKAQRVAFITERIDLTPEEAEEFWPMYNQFENDKKGIQEKYKRKKRVVNMTDQELEKHMLDSFARDQEVLDLKKSYFQKFKKILPVRKLAMFQIAEKEFRKNIVGKLKENRGRRRGRNN